MLGDVGAGCRPCEGWRGREQKAVLLILASLDGRWGGRGEPAGAVADRAAQASMRVDPSVRRCTRTSQRLVAGRSLWARAWLTHARLAIVVAHPRPQPSCSAIPSETMVDTDPRMQYNIKDFVVCSAVPVDREYHVLVRASLCLQHSRGRAETCSRKWSTAVSRRVRAKTPCAREYAHR
jgi:hypothetical protein